MHPRRGRRFGAALLVSALALVGQAAPARASGLTASDTPVISGIPRVGSVLTVVPGGYSAQPDAFGFQWYADGDPVGTYAPVYRPTTGDLDATITVEVTAHAAADHVTTESAATGPVGAPGRVTAWGASTAPAGLAGRTVVAVSAGNQHSLALTADGDVIGWGTTTPPDRTDPGDLLDGRSVVDVAAGGLHSLALTDDGEVIGWGADDHGQATAPPELTGETLVEIAAGLEHSLALTDDGEVVAWGNDADDRATVPAALDGRTAVAVAAGAQHSLALLADGTVVAWGANGQQQATVPGSLADERVVAIAAGGQFSLALTDDGAVTAWGDNTFDQQVVPPSLDDRTVVAIAAGYGHALAVTDDFRLTAWGWNDYNQGRVPTALAGRPVGQVAAGGLHGVAITPMFVSGSPAITGTAQVDHELAVDVSSIVPTPDVVTYQWRSGGDPIPGADDPTYTLTGADAGDQISVAVTASRAGHDDATFTSAAVGPVADGVFTTPPSPAITGAAQTGRTLTATPGTIVPTPGATAYAWFANGTQVPGASTSTLLLSSSHVGKSITVRVTATRPGYAAAAVTSAAVGPVVGATPGPTPRSPVVKLTATTTRLRLGQSTTLSWTSTDATAVTASGAWTGSRGLAGSATITPTATGTATYVATAANGVGSAVAQVSIEVGLPAARLRVSVPRTPRTKVSGSRLVVTGSGLAAGETYTIRLGTRTVATGTASATGVAQRTIRLPKVRRATGQRLTIVGSLADRTGSTTVRVVPKPRR